MKKLPLLLVSVCLKLMYISIANTSISHIILRISTNMRLRIKRNITNYKRETFVTVVNR